MQHVVYYPSNSNSKMVAGARIARWLFDNLGVAHRLLIDSTSIAAARIKGSYILYMVNVPKTMIKDVPRTEALIQNATIVVWVQNDYSIYAPTLHTYGVSIVTRAFTYRIKNKLPTYVWSTCRDRCVTNPDDYRYINWNALAYAPIKNLPKRRINSHVLYFGSFREGRIKEFDKYMTDANIFHISAPKTAEAKFKERYGFAGNQLIGIVNIPTDLTKYSTTLYMEDDLSHRQFHSPANRFYEALSAGMAILVDRAAVGTLTKAGFVVPELCVVEDANDVRDRLRVHRRVRNMQQEWARCPSRKIRHDAALRERLGELLLELCCRSPQL